MSAIGFPVAERFNGNPKRILDERTTQVDVAGGSWGDGILAHWDLARDWQWEPLVGYSTDMTREALSWIGVEVPQLRLRAVATLPWADARKLAIVPDLRKQLADHLPYSDLAGIVTTLSRRRGGDLPASSWRPGTWGNNRDQLDYVCSVIAADGTLVLEVEVMVALPGANRSTVTTCAELRIHDFAAWADAVHQAGGQEHPDLRLTFDELHEFYAVAWQMATESLPGVLVDDQSRLRWAGVPMVEFRMGTERQHNSSQPHMPLRDALDLTGFGQRGAEDLFTMSVSLTARPQFEVSARRHVVREAFSYMGQAFGFIDS